MNCLSCNPMNAPTVIDLKRKIGQQLIEKGLISVDQLDIALTEQKKNGRLLGEILVGLGFVSESIMRDVLSQALGIASVDLGKVVPDRLALDLIEKEIAERYTVIPVSFDSEKKQLKIAMKNASDLMILDRVHAIVGRKTEIVPMVAGESEIKKAIDQFYGYELSVDGILHEIETGEIDYQSLDATEDEYSQPLVRLVDAILVSYRRSPESHVHDEYRRNAHPPGRPVKSPGTGTPCRLPCFCTADDTW
jgi:type IV pilus assembly protein PilB